MSMRNISSFMLTLPVMTWLPWVTFWSYDTENASAPAPAAHTPSTSPTPTAIALMMLLLLMHGFVHSDEPTPLSLSAHDAQKTQEAVRNTDGRGDLNHRPKLPPQTLKVLHRDDAVVQQVGAHTCGQRNQPFQTSGIHELSRLHPLCDDGEQRADEPEDQVLHRLDHRVQEAAGQQQNQDQEPV